MRRGTLRLGWREERSPLTLLEALSAFPLARFAFGSLAVVGDIAFQAAQRAMPAKALHERASSVRARNSLHCYVNSASIHWQFAAKALERNRHLLNAWIHLEQRALGI